MNGLPFAKMSGAGNDFVAVDNRDRALDGLLTGEFIRRICTRGLSVGADGLLELRDDPDHAFEMVYYNRDGEPAPMCGNGGRCIVRFAAHLGLVDGAPGGDVIRFRSGAGVHRAMMAEDPGEVVLWMTPARTIFLERTLSFEDGRDWKVSLVDTGVPHAVISVGGNEVDALDMDALAPAVRSSHWFSPGGANVDFVSVRGDKISIRTWERGVEGETLACGTGAVAAAVVLSSLGLVTLPVSIEVKSGLTLTVGMGADGPWLQGEARLVYTGSLSEHWPA